MPVPVYPYFYPLTANCPERTIRAEDNGHAMVDETQLAQDSLPLFEQHRQPLIYCLGDTAIRNWDDSDPAAMRAQTELAADHGVDGFIFDSFIGVKDGTIRHEMSDVLDDTFMQNSSGLAFGIMSVLASPRVVLPVPKEGHAEPNRDYDMSKATIRAIIDHAVRQYWERDNYIRIKDRPYMSMFISFARPINPQDELTVPETFEYAKEYSNQRYNIDPYLVAVAQEAHQAQPALAHGADAMSSYALLPEFGKQAPPLQDYDTLLDQRIQQWPQMAQETYGKPYVPPAVVGWDASARGANGATLDDVAGIYPFTPIVQNATSTSFGRMLLSQYEFLQDHVPADEQYVPINAWNEITEGSALLPQVDSLGSADLSYLHQIRKFKEATA